MNRNAIKFGLLTLGLCGTVAMAQDAVPDTPVESTTTTTTPTMNGNGATVTREETTTTSSTPGEDGTETVTTTSDASQTVESPSGNTTTVTRTTDEDGKTSTMVDHTKMDHSMHTDHPAKPGDDDDGVEDPGTN